MAHNLEIPMSNCAPRVEGVLRTFGEGARYDDEPWAEHYEGQNGVRMFYEQLMKALPDLEITAPTYLRGRHSG